MLDEVNKDQKDEENKDQKQEQPDVPTVPPDVTQSTDSGNDVSPLLSGAPAQEVKEPQQGTGGNGARGQEGAQQAGTEDALGCDSPEVSPDAQGEGAGALSGGGETEQKPVSTEGTETPQGEVTPEVDDPSVTDESEEDKAAIARVLESYDEYLGRGDIHEPDDDPDVADIERDPTISPEYEEYEPPATLDLIRREGRIHVARIEWRGLRPTLTVISDRYSPPSMSSAVYRTVRLPNDVAEYQSAREVFAAVYAVLQSCSALSRQQCELLTFWCIASWFQDSLDFLPRITISGPRYAADLLFTLLSYVCRRAIPLVGMSSAVLKQINIEQLRPTLLIHQVKASKTVTELLDATDYPGYIFVSAGEFREVCCAKIVYIGETYNPKQSVSGLHIHLGRNAPVPTAPYRSAASVERLQNQLFSYFAFNRERTEFLEVAPGELQPEFDVMARRLGAVIINDSGLQRRLVELLKGWSEDLRAERAGGVEGTVLTAALNHAHNNEPQAYVREVTAGANQIRSEQGEPQKLGNEKVGHLLKKLGLRTHRDMKGSALVFDQETQLLLHELCFEYDVLPAAPECGYCHKLQTPESE